MQKCECGCGIEVPGKWKRGHSKRVPYPDPPYITTLSGCYEWLGPRDHEGYGRCDPRRIARGPDGMFMIVPMQVDKPGPKRARAHRVVYEVCVGPIPEGYVVRHICDNPSCVRPSHLLVGTVIDNNRDMKERDRHYRTDACPKGHTEFYIYTEKDGGTHKQCKECTAERDRRRKRERAS